MLRPVLHQPICPTPGSRVIALALLLVVGWSSVEVLWAQEEPASEEYCPCFCA